MTEKEEFRPALSWKDALLALAEANKELSQAKKEAEEKDKEIARLKDQGKVACDLFDEVKLERERSKEWKQCAEKIEALLTRINNEIGGIFIDIPATKTRMRFRDWLKIDDVLSDYQKFKESKEKQG